MKSHILINLGFITNRSSSIHPSMIPVDKMASTSDAMSRAIGLDNSGIVDLQRQLIREQDEELEKLGMTIQNTRNIGWAINEEFRLLDQLSVGANKYVEVPDSRVQRLGRRLSVLNKGRRRGCSLWKLLFTITGILVLVALFYVLVKYL